MKGVLGIVHRRPHERIGALVHQARVRTEDEHDRPGRIGTTYEFIDVGAFQGDHCKSLGLCLAE